jgi:hypothetical protein
MGYVEGTHNYRVWNPARQKIVKTRDVVFVNFANGPDSPSSPIPPILQELQDKEPDLLVTDATNTVNRHISAPESPRFLLQRLAEIENQRDHSDDSSDGYNSDSSEDPLLLKPAHANMVTMEPKSFSQAQQDGDCTQWELAMQAELAKMDKYKVWTIVDRDSVPNIRTVGAKWVYTRKIDGNTGKPSKYKARWVAKGYSQIEGVNFDELFAAVAHKDTIRLCLAIVNYYDWEMDQVNIVAAFLNGDLEETIYMEPPGGSDIPISKVLRLNKALYGLKQSPRCFNKSLDKWLHEQGFESTNGDSCLYYRSIDNNKVLISLHVDDQLIASNNWSHLDIFKKQLDDMFECSDSGPANYFLVLNITRDRSSKVLQLGQQHYVDKVLNKFDMAACNPVTTPLPPEFKPVPATCQISVQYCIEYYSMKEKNS